MNLIRCLHFAVSIAKTATTIIQLRRENVMILLHANIFEIIPCNCVILKVHFL